MNRFKQETIIQSFSSRGIEWSLRAFANMRTVRLLLRARAVINFLINQSINQSINHLFSNAGLQSGSHKADVDLQRTNEI